jgi:hypothetical protein
MQKVTINFVMSVCLSVHMEQLSSHYTDFHKIWELTIFRYSVKKVKVLLKFDKHNRYFAWRCKYIYDYISMYLLGMINFSDKSCRENQNTYFMLNNFFLKIVLFMR